MTSSTLVRRRLDYVLLPALVLGIVNSLALSLPEGLGMRADPDSPWPPLRALHTWAVEQEPQHLVMPPTLQASLLYDGFVQLALLLVLTVGLARLKSWPWLRTLAVVYAVSAVMNMYFYFMQTFLGPDSPPHLGTYLPINLPWLIVPILVAYRFWPSGNPERSAPEASLARVQPGHRDVHRRSLAAAVDVEQRTGDPRRGR